jgi:hypothetical protein
MQFNQMVYQMCYETLAAVDVNAIRKARGFSQNESASRSVFENAFLSSTGLENAMSTLSTAEVAALHLLNKQAAPVTIAFFERLYGSNDDDRYYRTTYSQRYKPTLDAVKKQLVRKGVLIMFDEKSLSETVQMERWRFMLPPAFARFLPPLVPAPHVSTAPGITRDRLWVEKVREGLGQAPVSTHTAQGRHQVSLEHGTLRMGKKPLQAHLLEVWQRDSWIYETPMEILSDEEEDEVVVAAVDDDYSLYPVDAVLDILGRLGPGQWVRAGKMAEPLKIFAYGVDKLQPDKLCQSGWKWGCLARLSEGGETYYRLAAHYADHRSDEPLNGWLESQADASAAPGGAVLRVNLDKAPLPAFEQLNVLTHLSFEQGQLLARPDPVKLGRSSPALRQSALAAWLREQWPAFAAALALVEQRWGQVVVHQGLLVARVRDLSLRVQIERELKEQVVVLSTEFIAFPPGLRPDVERILKKSGFVVKEVRA